MNFLLIYSSIARMGLSLASRMYALKESLIFGIGLFHPLWFIVNIVNILHPPPPALPAQDSLAGKVVAQDAQPAQDALLAIRGG